MEVIFYFGSCIIGSEVGLLATEIKLAMTGGGNMNYLCLTVYDTEGLPFAWDLSLQNSPDSYLCF